MISYHVFFTPKPGIEDDHVVELAHRFFKQLISEKKLRGYRILRVTNPANFQALPRFQAIADYKSQVKMTTFSSGTSIIVNVGATPVETPFGCVEREGVLITIFL